MKDMSYKLIDLATDFKGETAGGVAEAMRGLYDKEGYAPPWVGYFAKNENGEIAGSCSFKSPPKNGRVEIAYFVFPEFEGMGIATNMATYLIKVAMEKDKDISIFAQTLPENNASTSILKKLGFKMIGTVEHPEDGSVWEWILDSR